MKKELMDIICCPTCKGGLQLSIDQEKDNEINQGHLLCNKCNVTYDIIDGIPDLLPKKSEKK
jgi:uncharacterized protein YbaR (Trm112 family)